MLGQLNQFFREKPKLPCLNCASVRNCVMIENVSSPVGRNLFPFAVSKSMVISHIGRVVNKRKYQRNVNAIRL